MLLLDLMTSAIVVDEFHEILVLPGFNLLLKELLDTKRLCEKSDMLLVSATPNMVLTQDFLGLEDIIKGPSFNKQPYKFAFENYSDMDTTEDSLFYKKQASPCLVITNTAISAQKSYVANLTNENALLCHSKYSEKDKGAVFDAMINAFGIPAEKQNKKLSLRSSPVTQASLNITVDEIITELTSAENWCQRLGRLDRFGEGRKNLMTTGVPPLTGSSVRRFLGSMNQRESAEAWLSFIEKRLGNGEQYLPDIYDLYFEFYNDHESLVRIRKDVIAILSISANQIESMGFCPVQFPHKKVVKTEKLKSKSLRGSGSYVKMGILDIQHLPCVKSSQYFQDNISMGNSEILGFGNKGKDLLLFMRKKLNNIVSESIYKQAYGGRYIVERDNLLLLNASESSAPIYVSYVESDLEAVNASQPDDAMLYVVCDKQPIGIMKIKDINELKN
jgi:CRISPR-associated endonuclease/helicase Cas3